MGKPKKKLSIINWNYIATLLSIVAIIITILIVNNDKEISVLEKLLQLEQFKNKELEDKTDIRNIEKINILRNELKIKNIMLDSLRKRESEYVHYADAPLPLTLSRMIENKIFWLNAYKLIYYLVLIPLVFRLLFMIFKRVKH